MPVATSRLSLVKTARWRPEYELREDGLPVGRLLCGGPRGSAEAIVGDRSWTLRPGSCRSAVDATDAAGSLGASLRDGQITIGDDPRPSVSWRQNRTSGACAELVGGGCTAVLRIRRRTAPGLDVTVEGELLERELLVLLAGYDLLR